MRPSELRLKVTVDDEQKVPSVPNPHDVIGQFFRLISRQFEDEFDYEDKIWLKDFSGVIKNRHFEKRKCTFFFNGKISTIVAILEGG